jgi:tripartite-type tricarboxylate transporter receptor subunit TctC
MTGAWRAALIAALVSGAVAGQGQAADGGVTYKGKTLSLIINSAGGGATDYTNRTVGGYLVKYLPGSPQIVFRNIVGGGGIKANNYFYSQVAPDGMTFLGGSSGQVRPAKVRVSQAKYDPAKYEFIGGDGNLGAVMVVRNDSLARLTDPSAGPVVFGDTDGSRTGVLSSLWAKETLGWNLRWVVGYASLDALTIAVRSKELDTISNPQATRIKPLLETGEFTAVAQVGVREASGKMVPRSAFPDVPVFYDMILPKLKDKERSAFLSMYSDFLINKWMALPPGTPQEHVQAYRTAYNKVIKDPEFLKFAESYMGEEYLPLSGEEVQAIVRDLGSTSDGDIAFLKTMAKKYGVQQVD